MKYLWLLPLFAVVAANTIQLTPEDASYILTGKSSASSVVFTTNCTACQIQVNAIFYNQQNTLLTLQAGNNTYSPDNLSGKSVILIPPLTLTIEAASNLDFVIAFSLTNTVDQGERGLLNYRLESLDINKESIYSFTTSTTVDWSAFTVTSDVQETKYLQKVALSANCGAGVYAGGVPSTYSMNKYFIKNIYYTDGPQFLPSLVDTQALTFIIGANCTIQFSFANDVSTPTASVGSSGFAISREFPGSFGSRSLTSGVTTPLEVDFGKGRDGVINVEIKSVDPGNGQLVFKCDGMKGSNSVLNYFQPINKTQVQFTGSKLTVTWSSSTMPRNGFAFSYSVSAIRNSSTSANTLIASIFLFVLMYLKI